MTRRYRYHGRIGNQRIGAGIVVANGMIYVQPGHDAEFQAIPWVRRGLADGTITYLGEEVVMVAEVTPDSVEPETGLSLSAAARIAREEFGLGKPGFKRLLDDGTVPGKLESGEYSIQEGALREALQNWQSQAAED